MCRGGRRVNVATPRHGRILRVAVTPRGQPARPGSLLTTVAPVVKRVFEFLPAAGRQAVPVTGIFAFGWAPPSAIAVYWLESVLLTAVAVVWCLRLRARTPPHEIAKAGVDAKAVASFHFGSLAVFGMFLGGVLYMLSANGDLDQPFDWEQVREGAVAMAVVIATGFAVDLLLWGSLSVAAVQQRVDGCTRRWALLWLVGFAGTALMMFTGRAGIFLGLFAILKVIWEISGALSHLLGWTSLRQRTAESRPR